MNKSLNTTTLRLSPAKALLDLQHQTNHYRHIINPRKISSHQSSRQNQKRKIYSSYIESKFQKQRRQSIQRENQRILKDCVQIYKAKGILQKAQEQNEKAQKSPKRTLVNPYKIKEQMQTLKKQNKTYKQKLEKLRPIIGDKQQWKRHEQFTAQLIDKLRNKGRAKVYNTQTIVKIALSCEKQKTDYLSCFKTLNLEQKRTQSKQDNRTAETKTARSKRKTKRTKKRQEPLNDQDINAPIKKSELPIQMTEQIN